jgi:hypothetical protein
MRYHFAVAPWSTSLKATSALGTIILLGVGIGAYHAVPVPTGFTHQFGLAVAFVLPALVVGCVLFMVTGYAVEGSELYVERLVSSTRISIQGLTRVWLEPAVCKGSLRVFGNGGLFSFSGLFYNRKLGRYRLFATDFSRAVVLILPRRVVVVTPAAPEAFIEHLHHFFPDIHVGPQVGGN